MKISQYFILTDFQVQLLEFVKEQHGQQKRKYTGGPYWEHPLAVAGKVFFIDKLAIEGALCHDLFEDTSCNFDRLFNKMVEIGYERDYAYDVCRIVTELTDVFTKEAYPYLNRRKRKEAEAKRLGEISPIAQTIKYADLIDNTSSIVEHDEGFAKIYLTEKRDILRYMVKGNLNLFYECLSTLENAELKLGLEPILK